MNTLIREQIYKQVNSKQHKKIILDIFSQTEQSEHSVLCDYVINTFKKYNSNKSTMRSKKIDFINFFLEEPYLRNKKNTIIPSIKGLEDFGDAVNKEILHSRTEKMINRLFSVKYREKLVNQDVFNCFREIVLGGVEFKIVKNSIGLKLASYKNSDELCIQLEKIINESLKWEYSIISERALKYDLVEGFDFDYCYNQDNRCVLSIHTFKASQAFGSYMWCITRTKAMFDNYRKNGMSYHFMFDFNKKINDNYSLIAILTNNFNRVESIYDKRDELLSMEKTSHDKVIDDEVKFSKSIINLFNSIYIKSINDTNTYFINVFKNKIYMKMKFGDKIDLNDIKHIEIFSNEISKLNLVISIDFINKYRCYFTNINENKDFILTESNLFLENIMINKALPSFYRKNLFTYFEYSEDFLINFLRKNMNVLKSNGGDILISAEDNNYKNVFSFVLENKNNFSGKDRFCMIADLLPKIDELHLIKNYETINFIKEFLSKKDKRYLIDKYSNQHLLSEKNCNFDKINDAFNIDSKKLKFKDSRFSFVESKIYMNGYNIDGFISCYDFNDTRSIDIFLAKILNNFFKNNDLVSRKTNTKLYKEHVSKHAGKSSAFNFLIEESFFSNMFRSHSENIKTELLTKSHILILDQIIKSYPQHKERVFNFIKKHKIIKLSLLDVLFNSYDEKSMLLKIIPLISFLKNYQKLYLLNDFEKIISKYKDKKYNPNFFMFRSFSSRKNGDKLIYEELKNTLDYVLKVDK